MLCRHQFFKIGERTKTIVPEVPPEAGQLSDICYDQPLRAPQLKRGIEVGCANCGQVRAIWDTGEAEIVKPGQGPLTESAE